MGLWVDGGVKALVQAVTWTCPDGMVSFPMTGTAYSRYLSSVQCSLQCILVHNLGACTSLCVLVQLGLEAVVLVPSLPCTVSGYSSQWHSLINVDIARIGPLQ